MSALEEMNKAMEANPNAPQNMAKIAAAVNELAEVKKPAKKASK